MTYYDFRYNTPEAGVPTDYWFVHGDAGADLTDPANWNDEVRLTDESFDLEDSIYVSAPGVQHGYMIGDYEGLASDGRDFLTLFTQADPGDHGSAFFRRVRATGEPVTDDASVVAGEAELRAMALWYAQLEQESRRQTQRETKPASAELTDLVMLGLA